LAPKEKDVAMASLRHPLSGLGCSCEFVSLNERHALKVLGQHTRGEKAGDASAGDDCMMKRTGHRRPSLSRIKALN
jgi:hypothetical protein